MIVDELRGRMVYLAAPYSDPDPAVIEERMKHYWEVDAMFIEHGVFTMSPLAKHSILKYRNLPGNWEYWQHYSRYTLLRCEAMVVITLPGWKESTGVTEEIKLAQQADMPMYKVGVAFDTLQPWDEFSLRLPFSRSA